MVGFSYELKIRADSREVLEERIKEGIAKLTGRKVRLSFPIDGEKLVCLGLAPDEDKPGWENLVAVGEGYFVPGSDGLSQLKVRVYVSTVMMDERNGK